MLFTNAQFLSNLIGSSGWNGFSIGPFQEFTEVAGRYSGVDYDYSAPENKFIVIGRAPDYSTAKVIQYDVNSTTLIKGTEQTISPGTLWPNKFIKLSNTYGLYGSQWGCPNIQNLVNYNFSNGTYSSYGGVHNCNGGTTSMDPVSSTKVLATMISNGHGAAYGIGGANIKVVLANHNGSAVSSISTLDYGSGADQSYTPGAVSRPFNETRSLLVYKTNITLSSTVGLAILDTSGSLSQVTQVFLPNTNIENYSLSLSSVLDDYGQTTNRFILQYKKNTGGVYNITARIITVTNSTIAYGPEIDIWTGASNPDIGAVQRFDNATAISTYSVGGVVYFNIYTISGDVITSQLLNIQNQQFMGGTELFTQSVHIISPTSFLLLARSSVVSEYRTFAAVVTK